MASTGEDEAAAAGGMTPAEASGKDAAAGGGTPSQPQGSIPVNVISARRAEANSALKQAELERRYQEELRWQRKEAEHYKTEYEAARVKRVQLEEALEALRTDLTRQLKDALAEAEELRTRGGERGARAELDLARRELEAALADKASLQAQLADSVEGNKAVGKQCTELRARTATLTSDKQALEQQLAASQAQCTSLARKMEELQEQTRSARAQAGESEAQAQRLTTELQGQRQALDEARVARAGLEKEVEQARTHVERADAEARAAKEAQAQQAQRLSDVEQELAALREQESTMSLAAAAAEREAAERTRVELVDLRAEYARAVYDMAKARAEHSEMAGKLAKVLAQKDLLQQRLATLQLAHTEVELAARTALDDVSAVALMHQHVSDQDLGAHSTNCSSNLTSAVSGGAPVPVLAPGLQAPSPLHAPAGVMGAGGLLQSRTSETGVVSVASSLGGADDGGGAVRAVALARLQLERVRKLAGDALSAVMADRKAGVGVGAVPGTGALSHKPSLEARLPGGTLAPAQAAEPQGVM